MWFPSSTNDPKSSDPEGSDFGVKQSTSSRQYGIESGEIFSRIEDSRNYLKSSRLDRDLLELCRNEHKDCTIWAMVGECDKNEKCE